jgi:hypothetical protein
MSDTQQNDWTKPAAMAIPKGGVFNDKVQQGRYGPIYPKSPACYGFTIIAKIIPGREDVFYEYARNIEKAVADQPDCLGQDNDLIVIESAEAAGRHSSARSMRDLSVVRLYRLARSTRTASAPFEKAEKGAPISSSIHELNCSAS